MTARGISNKKKQLMPTTKEAIDTALIIDEPWIDYILRGEKTWEMRAQPTHKRGRIGLIRKGSGTIVGEATVVDCLAPLSRAQMLENIHKHRIPKEMIVSGQVEKWRYPWVLADVERYETPIPYAHPNGAVIWVNVRELKGSTDSPAFEGPDLDPAIKRMSNPDSAAIVQTAETLAAKYLRRLGAPTKYIAGFQSKSGRQLAIERNKQGLFVWIEKLPPDAAGIAIRNQKNPGQPYAATQSRNSNLRSRAPRLAEGNVAYYTSIDSLDAFEGLLRWYAE